MRRNFQLIGFTILASALSAAGLLARLSWSNVNLIILDTLLRPFAVITALTLALGALVYCVSNKVFALVPFLVFVFFNHSGASKLFGTSPLAPWLGAVILAVLIAIVVYLIRNRTPLQTAKASAFLFAAMTVPFALPIAGLLFQTSPPEFTGQFADYVDTLDSGQHQQSELPDVIYIVPDRYAGSSTLQATYNHVNEDFYRQLRQHRFIVSKNSIANYPTTAHSMSSTMNSGYLDAFTNTYGVQSGRLQPLYSTIENSHAQRAMRRLGYTLINAGSWWDAARTNANASENYGTGFAGGLDRVVLSEIEYILWQNTPVNTAIDFGALAAGITECRRIKRKIDWLGKVGNRNKPVFVLAHMTIPHTPIVADREGNCLQTGINYPAPGVSWPQFKSAYADYLQYFNSAILSAFEHQLERRTTSGRQLIFVIQSDEGPYPEIIRKQDKEQNYIDLPPDKLAIKLGILNAMYLAGDQSVGADELTTPINNWRIILEKITGKPAGRNDHKVHIYKDYQRIHDYVDITAQHLK